MEAWQSIQATVDWIENHLDEKISIRQLAKIAYLSPFYYQRLFRRLIGKPVMEYVKLRRLARVSNRLIFNRDNILNTSYYYGFENHETFCRTFKQEYGMTPTEYRSSMKAVHHFQKPILTEKGCYVMEYDVKVEDLDAIDYLAVTHMISMDDEKDSIGVSMKLWDKCLKDGSIKRLSGACGTDAVYALFSNKYIKDTNMISYDFACVNSGMAQPGEFTPIHIRPAKYAVFSCSCEAPMTKAQAYDRLNIIFWGEWLPQTNYACVIDNDFNEGSASIELYSPLEVNAEKFTIKIWYPIEEKQS